MTPGHLACQGCGATLAMRYALKGLGPQTTLVIPACCWTILSGPVPRSSLKVPLLHAPFASAAAVACGVKAGYVAKGDTQTQVVAWAGDGGTFDIGIQALSGAAERNDDIIYVCYDNEAYMNTGVQRSSGTPIKAWTTTTPLPQGNRTHKKDLDAIVQAHHVPYMATATIAYPEDMVRKFQKARTIQGFRFIHVLSPCPPGWKYDTEDTVAYSRLAVQTGIWTLYEVENGQFKLNMNIAKRKPVTEYLKGQGRFRKLTTEDAEALQKRVDAHWGALDSRRT